MTFTSTLVLFLVYITLALGLTALFARDRSRLNFLVAKRNIGRWPAAFSIAATWIWAPALFIAAQKAFTQGWVGVFWFTVPNVACLVVFSFFAQRIRERMPEGFTLSELIRNEYSRRTQGVYLFQLSGLAACSFAVQLLAGGLIVSRLTGLDFTAVTIVLALIALSYSLWSGLKASIITDYAQMALIIVVGVFVVPWAVNAAGGFSAISAGIGGATGEYTSLFSGVGGTVFLSFGLATTIGLMSGPFGDQSFWQRAFATREGETKRAFIYGAGVFAVVPLLMSLLGFAAAGSGFAPDDVSIVNLEFVQAMLPAWVVFPFTLMLLSGLVSTLDSNLAAIGSLAGGDFDRGKRTAMLALAGIAVLIANIPGMQILYLFLFYGTLRASTLVPTVLTLLNVKLSEWGVFYGVLAAIVIGLPIFAYGNFTDRTPYIVAGALLTVSLSGVIAFAARSKEQERLQQ